MSPAAITFPVYTWAQKHWDTLSNTLITFLWVGITAYLVFGFWGVTYDDVFLAFQYASHLESGLGFVFNAGENFLGTPAPLFVLLLAGMHQLFPWITLPQIGSLLSGMGLSLSGWMAYRIGWRFHQRWVGLLCGLLIVTSPFTVMTLGGETPIFLAMTMAAVYFYFTDRYSISAILLALAMVNRSEAIIPIFILLAYYVYEKRRLPFAMIAGLAVILVPWFVYSFIAFGGPVSNSFTAKIAQVAAGLDRYPIGFRHWTGRIVRQTHYLLLAIVPATGLGVLTLPFALKPWRIIAAWTLAQTVAYALLPIPFYHWYAAQVGVLSAVLVTLGTVQIVKWILHPPERLVKIWKPGLIQAHVRIGSLPASILFGTLAVLCLVCAGTVLLAQARFTRNYQVTMPNPSNRIYTNTGIWLAENTPKDARIAYLEIGQIAFYSNRYMVDMLGLVSPGISQRVAQNNWLWAFQKYKPDYIIYNAIFANWMDYLYAESWFTKGFEEVAQIDDPGYPNPLRIFHKKVGVEIPDPTEIDLSFMGGQDTTGEIYSGRTVKQTFVARQEGLSAFELRVGTYAHVNQGTLQVSLSGEDGHAVASWQVDGSDLLDNRWRRFDMTPVENSLGKKFALEVRYDPLNGQDAVTLWRSGQADRYLDGKLSMDDRAMNGVLDLRTYYSPPK
ncbi:MAG: hypothetical protein PHQ40_00915 [Anaerolineaceae bacterium]|nr:hypothetical protein [Anaerolineaceae bacterium]